MVRLKNAETLGALIRARRLERNISQVLLAKSAGVGINTLRNIEAGKAAGVRVRTMSLVAMALGISMTDFFEGTEMLENDKSGNGADNGAVVPDGGSSGNHSWRRSDYGCARANANRKAE